MSNIILPNGKIFPPSEFLFISIVLKKLGTYKVKKFQIVQRKLDEIDILIVIDDDLRKTGPSFDEIAKKIKNVYSEKTGPNVKIRVEEVDEIKDDSESGKPAPLVVSYANINDSCKISK